MATQRNQVPNKSAKNINKGQWFKKLAIGEPDKMKRNKIPTRLLKRGENPKQYEANHQKWKRQDILDSQMEGYKSHFARIYSCYRNEQVVINTLLLDINN